MRKRFWIDTCGRASSQGAAAHISLSPSFAASVLVRGSGTQKEINLRSSGAHVLAFRASYSFSMDIPKSLLHFKTAGGSLAKTRIMQMRFLFVYFAYPCQYFVLLDVCSHPSLHGICIALCSFVCV